MSDSSSETDYANGQFCWVDLLTRDLAASSRFYENLFGWNAEEQDTGDGPPYTMFFRDGEVVAGIREMSSDMKERPIRPMWNSYVHVSDAEKAVGRAQAAGGTVVIPPTELLGLGSLAFVTDREGAVVGLWQAGTHHGATRVNRPGSLCWNELNTSDLTDAKTFYGRLFGWSYRTNPDFPSPYSTIENERRENGGMMEMTDEWDDLPPHWSVYFAVENIERSMQRLEQLDGRVHTGPFNTEHGPMAVVEDPQGATFNLIELSEERR